MDMDAFRSEKTHDLLLIDLVKELDRLGGLDLLEKHFDLPPTGPLLNPVKGGPFRYFDVILTFANLSVVVESKVDSDEKGRHDRNFIPNRWQTYEIESRANADTSLKNRKEFRFITYGTSEFYTKEDFATGPANKSFKHIKLVDMIGLLEDCTQMPLNNNDQFQGWLDALLVEKAKRDASVDMLAAYSLFRDKYLDCSKDLDLPTNRIAFNAPELAFPLFANVAEIWTTKGYDKAFGKLAVYPVARKSPSIHDSILNFWELWAQGDAFLCDGLLPKSDDWSRIYLEVNEDYNLNLKMDTDKSFIEPVRNFLRTKSLGNIPIRNTGRTVTGRPRFYRQGVHVLYEWDFGLLSNVMNLDRVTDDLFWAVDYISKELK